MTTTPFKITPTPPTSIKLEPGRNGKFSFTVESLAAPDKVHEVMVQALLVEDGQGKEVDWLIPGPQRTLSMTGGETETVTITAKPTSTSPRGQHDIKLVIAEKERPNDVFAESPAVACEITGPAEKPPRPKTPWWLIAAIAGGVVVVGGVIVAQCHHDEDEKPRGLGEDCSKDRCDTGLVCVTGKCSPAVKPGDACEGSCPEPLLCDAKRCVEKKGRPCTDKSQCITRWCEGGVCDDPVPMRVCTEDSDCGPEQSCRPVQPDRPKRCKWTPGHACTGRAECTSNWCNEGFCSRDDGKCDRNDCPAPYLCTNGECLVPDGQPCGNNSDCKNRYCDNSVCAPSPCPTCPRYCNFTTKKCNDKPNPVPDVRPFDVFAHP